MSYFEEIDPDQHIRARTPSNEFAFRHYDPD